MKIALVCNTYIRNYGSILQSLAMYIVLKKYADEVCVVNYKDYPTRGVKLKIFWYIQLPLLFNLKKLYCKVKILLQSRFNTKYRMVKNARSKAMDDFVNTNFIFTEKCTSIQEAKDEILKRDLVVLGSDQLWGPVDILRDYHTLAFLPLNFIRVAYATSFGVSVLPYFLKNKTAKFLSDFHDLSVREDSGADIVYETLGKRPKVVVDPTLLLVSGQWDQILECKKKINEKYIFSFFLGENIKHRQFVQRIKNLTGLQIVTMQYVDEYIKADDEYADICINNASPADFVSLIKYADYIFTDSFHATAFSLQYHKYFFTFDRYEDTSRNSRNSRIKSLFNHLELQKRHITGTENIIDLLNSELDYNLIDHKIAVWRAQSIEYLKNALLLNNDTCSK